MQRFANIKRSAPRKRRPGPPRRGRIIDRDFMEFARERGCILRKKHQCRGSITFHHVRECGSPKNDRRGIGLCEAGHLHDAGQFSIERLGKEQWQTYWAVDLEQEIAALNAVYSIARESQA